MIHVDRSRVQRPPVLDSMAAVTERAEARKFFNDPRRSRQERFGFEVYKRREIAAALTEVFHDKCAYCESPIGLVTPKDVTHYRPKSSVTGRPEHPGYWWLASDWDNLLVSCPDCDRVRSHAGERSGKGTRFPIADESKRAFEEGGEADETPLLLDPCRDHPESHLVFDPTGLVVSDTLQGQTTITVVGLNRRGLVEARQQVAADLAFLIDNIEGLLAESPQGSGPSSDARDVLARLMVRLRDMLDAAAPYAGLARQLAAPFLARYRLEPLGGVVTLDVAQAPVVTKARHSAAKRSFREFQERQSSFSLETAAGRETYKEVRRVLEQVTIRNVKALRDVEIDFRQEGSGRTPWRMLLGENGTGKSTVLQAIALTLIGASSFLRLANMEAVHPRDYIRYRCKSGTVRVKVSGFIGPHQLTFLPDRVEFLSPTAETSTVRFGAKGPVVEGRGWEPQMLLLAYGATRLLPRSSSPQVTSIGDTYSRVDNLFDPFVPLRDAEAWLVGLGEAGDLQFDTAAAVLKELLRLDPQARFLRAGERILVMEHGERVPLRQLSDGYQSVVATAADILDILTNVYTNLDDASGLVLLDEIGAHLHPSWKMRIVDSIRRAVPGLQFVTSTHDPLCLRGLEAGEVVVMRRDERHRVFTVDNLPSPADLRIEQLLTSEFFGLNSTVDPEVEREFDRYYALLAKRDRSVSEGVELEDLTGKLRDRRFLGITLREQLMYEAVDQIVADHKLRPVRSVPELKRETIDAVSKIWAETPAEARAP